ncbi:MAG: O-antigen ligase family protein [Candidatus Thermoplasmatota archaeon]|nr:O-antigen ligase family protein [Candidatus Thermoplasmatota archaeon]
MQNHGPFDFSKIFIFFSFLIIVYWLLFTKNKFNTYPRFLNFFNFFVLIHTMIVYLVLYPNELTFGYVGESHLQSGFIKVKEAPGMFLVRYFSFMTFGYAISKLVYDKKRFTIVAIALGFGLACVMLIGGYKAVYSNFVEIRFSGGFLDPNAFGILTVTTLLLNICVLFEKKNGKWIRRLSILPIIFGVIGTLFSGSRGAFLGLICGIIFFFVFLKKLNILLQTFVLIFTIAILLNYYLPPYIYEMVTVRASIEKVKDDKGAGRLDVWKDYLLQFSKYGLTGVGLNRSREAIKDTYSHRFSVTHNHYLAQIVEFGIAGIILFVIGIAELLMGLLAKNRNKNNTDTIFISALLFSMLIMVFFINPEGQREYWLVLGICCGRLSSNYQCETNNKLGSNVIY